MRRYLAAYAFFAGAAVPALAVAQLRPGEPLRLPAFEQNTASETTAEAVVVNPANLGFMPTSELRLSSVYLDDRGYETGQGHAVTLGFPLPFLNIGTALRLDLVDPPTVAARRSFGLNANYQWLTWGLGYRVSPALGLGASFQGSWSSRDALDGLSSFSLAATLRPSNYFALALIGQDLNGPQIRGGTAVHPGYQAGLLIRPGGKRSFEIGLDATYVDASSGYFVPRAHAGLEIAPLGRLHGEFSVADPNEENGERRFLAALKLSVFLNGPFGSQEAGIGSIAGDALGSDAEWQAHNNLTTTFAVRGVRERAGVSTSAYALRIRIEDGPSSRGHLALLRRLWRIAEHEPDVQAVVFRIRAAIGESLAHIQELRDAVWLLRQRGKKVLCELEDAGGGTLYFCSAANSIVMAPAGRLRFTGFSARYFFVPKLLEKLGVRAEYARIGAHKSAPEMFSHPQASDTARSDHVDLLQQFERHVVGGVALDRKIRALDLRQRLAEGPFSPENAQRAGLVDKVGYADELDAHLTRLVGSSLPLLDDHAPRAADRFGVGKSIAVLYVHGDMVDGRSRSIPLVGIDLAGSYTIVESIKKARLDPRIAAIVLRVETPGGSALAADVIWREVALTTVHKPVIVSIGSVGASAGYYIASAGTRVFANPLSITGSIGVFAGKVDASELLRKLGVSLETYKTGPRADADSLFRPLTEEERRELERKVGQFYSMFLGRVSAGRTRSGTRLSAADVDAVGQGRVWTGEQAFQRRLVDELGGFRQALAEARRLTGLSADAPILELPEEQGNFVYRMLGLAKASGQAQSSPLPLAGDALTLARALGPLVVHRLEWPLARLELVAVE